MTRRLKRKNEVIKQIEQIDLLEEQAIILPQQFIERKRGLRQSSWILLSMSRGPSTKSARLNGSMMAMKIQLSFIDGPR